MRLPDLSAISCDFCAAPRRQRLVDLFLFGFYFCACLPACLPVHRLRLLDEPVSELAGVGHLVTKVISCCWTQSLDQRKAASE